MRSQLMCLYSCIVQEHAEDANKMQEVDQEPLIQQMRQLGDTDFDDDMEEEGQMLALQVFGGAIPAPAEEDTKVADEVEESDGPLEGMDADGNELLFHKEQKQDSISIIDQLRIKPEEKSRLKIPLCRLWALPLVRLIKEVDVQRLENEFINGYWDGDHVLYVALYNNHKDSLDVSDNIMAFWNDHWKAASNRFDARLLADPDLAPMVGKMFYVWKGNHCLTNKFHANEGKWHMPVWCIVLDPRGNNGILLNAMNDINW